MTVEIISWSISTKEWDRTGIELATPGSAVRLASVARHVTDCATRPGRSSVMITPLFQFVCIMYKTSLTISIQMNFLMHSYFMHIDTISHLYLRMRKKERWYSRKSILVRYDSLYPINNLSVINERSSWVEPVLSLMFLLKDTTQWYRWGSNPRPLSLESSYLPLSHCAP